MYEMSGETSGRTRRKVGWMRSVQLAPKKNQERNRSEISRPLSTSCEMKFRLPVFFFFFLCSFNLCRQAWSPFRFVVYPLTVCCVVFVARSHFSLLLFCSFLFYRVLMASPLASFKRISFVENAQPQLPCACRATIPAFISDQRSLVER